jgi:regulatory LuxR family protein
VGTLMTGAWASFFSRSSYFASPSARSSRQRLLNKQVGGELGISEITVKAHRGQVMRKMKADSLPDLVTMAARLGLRSASNH